MYENVPVCRNQTLNQRLTDRNFSIVNILGFLGHMDSVAATQLCCYIVKAAVDNINE